MKSLVLVLALFCAAISVSAQTEAGSAIRALTVGDTVPDITFTNIINYHSKTARLSDFKDKIVIMDFWATWCGACIAKFPYLDSLQKATSDSLQIILVTYESKEITESFIKKNKIASKISLPIIYADTSLGIIFPKRMLPHYAWLAKNREIQAITSSERVNNNNVQTFLKNKKIILPVKKDDLAFNKNIPILDNEQGETKLLSHSVFTRYLEGVGVMAGKKQYPGRERIYFLNMPILMLYQEVVKPEYFNKIVLEVKNRSRFLKAGDKWSVWAPENTFCYELSVPDFFTKEQKKRYMKKDFDKYFELNSSYQTRKIKCYVFKKNTSEKQALKTNGGNIEVNVKQNYPSKFVRNVPFKRFLFELNRTTKLAPYPSFPIFIDETGITYNIDIDLPIADIHNIESLRNVVKKYGLEIIEEEREVEMFVISEVEN